MPEEKIELAVNPFDGMWGSIGKIALPLAQTHPLRALGVICATAIMICAIVVIGLSIAWRKKQEKTDKAYAIDAIQRLKIPDSEKASMITSIAADERKED